MMADTQTATAGAETCEEQQQEQQPQQQEQHENREEQSKKREQQENATADDDQQQQQEKPEKEQVEDNHVRAALKEDQGSEARLESWSSEICTKIGDNFMCTIRRINVTFSLPGRHNRQVSYVAKIKQGLIDGFGHFNDIMFEKECLMYEALVPAINTELKAGNMEALRMPQCYFYSLEEGKEVIILEDLTRSGFKMASCQLGLDAAHARLVVRELAKMNAASLLYQATLPSRNIAVHHPLMEKDWSNYSENAENEFGLLLKSDMIFVARVAEIAGRSRIEVAWLRDLATRAYKVFSQQLATTPPFDVLCHGDCWTNNFLFRYDSEGSPVELRMLDVQMSRRGSVALDLVTLMYTSLGGEERRTSLNSLLQEYYTSLSHVMQARDAPIPFTYEELVAEYQDKSLYGLIIGADYVPVVMVEATDALDFSMLGRGEEEFLRHRDENLPGILARNPHLTPLILLLLDDIADLGVFEKDQTTHV